MNWFWADQRGERVVVQRNTGAANADTVLQAEAYRGTQSVTGGYGSRLIGEGIGNKHGDKILAVPHAS